MSDLLYHIKRTIIRYDKDSSGATRDVDILGTFTDLAAAKDAADVALASEGYLPADFDIYDQKSKFPFEEWKHDDGVMVYAKAPTGPVFEVGLDTEINKGGFKGSKKGEVEGILFHVLQTTINYNIDRTGASQFTLVEGTFPTKTLAAAAALTTLLDDEITEESFAEFDVKDNFKGEWPYGEDCLVRAVGPTGENYFVRVKEPLRKGHRCKNGKCGCGDKAGCKQEGCKCPA